MARFGSGELQKARAFVFQIPRCHFLAVLLINVTEQAKVTIQFYKHFRGGITQMNALDFYLA